MTLGSSILRHHSKLIKIQGYVKICGGPNVIKEHLHAQNTWSQLLGAIQIIRDTFLAYFRPPRPLPHVSFGDAGSLVT